MGRCVMTRSKILKDLRFSSYREYLSSDVWESIRLRALVRDEFQCQVCGKSANHVHHRSYTREPLSGLSIDELVSLCKDCHFDVEFFPNGWKRTIQQANSRLVELLKINLPCWNLHAWR